MAEICAHRNDHPFRRHTRILELLDADFGSSLKSGDGARGPVGSRVEGIQKFRLDRSAERKWLAPIWLRPLLRHLNPGIGVARDATGRRKLLDDGEAGLAIFPGFEISPLATANKPPL